MVDAHRAAAVVAESLRAATTQHSLCATQGKPLNVAAYGAWPFKIRMNAAVSADWEVMIDSLFKRDGAIGARDSTTSSICGRRIA